MNNDWPLYFLIYEVKTLSNTTITFTDKYVYPYLRTLSADSLMRQLSVTRKFMFSAISKIEIDILID